MDYPTRQLNLAIKIMTESLKDKPRVIAHSVRLANNVHSWRKKCIAYLHDVLEDSNTTEQDLKDAGVDIYAVNSVVALTRTPPYTQNEYLERYIPQVKQDSDATAIKREDLKDHLRADRIDNLNRNQIVRYLKAAYELGLSLHQITGREYE